MGGRRGHPIWEAARSAIKQMYRWSPWRKGHFTFAGVVIRQTTNFDIHETQERYCEAIEPVK
eukprot:7259827-Alexandrium_andersonii.AAC.1